MQKHRYPNAWARVVCLGCIMVAGCAKLDIFGPRSKTDAPAPEEREEERLSDEARCWAQHGYYDRALSKQRAAVEIVRAQPDRRPGPYSGYLTTLARILQQSENYEEAAATVDEAIAVLEGPDGKTRPGLIGSASLGAVYELKALIAADRGDLKLYEASMSRSRELTDQSLLGVANDLAALLPAAKLQVEATERLVESNARAWPNAEAGLRELEPRERLSALDLTTIAELYASLSDLPAAVQALGLAGEASELDLRFVENAAIAPLAADLISRNAVLEAIAVTLAHASESPQSVRLAHWLLSSRKDRAFTASARVVFDSREFRPELLPEFREARARAAAEFLASFHEHRFLCDPDGPPPSPTVGQALGLETQLFQSNARDAVLNQTRAIVAAEHEVSSLTPTSPEAFLGAIRDRLTSDQALLEFVRFNPVGFDRPRKRSVARMGPARYSAFVMRKDWDRPKLIDLGPASVVDEVVVSLRRAVGSPTSALEDVHQLAQDAYDVVLSKLAGEIADAKHLLVTADGTLHRIPFEILHDGDSWLIDSHLVSYLNSTRDLRSPNKRQPSGPPVVFANPTPPTGYPDPSLSDFPALPGTEAEADAVSRHFDRVAVFQQAEAEEARLLSTRSPKFLHVAAHAVVLRSRGGGGTPMGRGSSFQVAPADSTSSTHEDAPIVAPDGLEEAWMRTALVLSERSASTEDPWDSFATAFEIARMDLRGTELVVLSACETGAGPEDGPHGIRSLRRAFMLAGARSVVSSLWVVADDATVQLMDEFYGRLAGGEPRTVALRTAQLAQKERHPHPFYWAPFILTGVDGG